jgi:transposase-like protein
VLDILVQSRRNAKAAKRLLRKLLKKQGVAPRVMTQINWRAKARPSDTSCRVLNIASTGG